MNLIDIETWLTEVVKKPDEFTNINQGDSLKKINNESSDFLNNYLKKVNEPFEKGYSDIFECIKGIGHSRYEEKTVWGYYTSYKHSTDLLETNNHEIIGSIIYDWIDDLNLSINDCVYPNFKRVLRFNDVPKHIYLKSKEAVYNSLVDICDLCISDKNFNYELTDQDFISEIVQETIEELNFIDEVNSLSNIYCKNDDIYWPHFYRAKFIVEKIHQDLNKRRGGPKPKIIKHLQGGYQEFCQDLNSALDEKGCIDGDLIKTWELAGFIIESEKYQFLTDQDGLNKFIKSVFDNKWLEFETGLELREIFKFESNYYIVLPNN